MTASVEQQTVKCPLSVEAAAFITALASALVIDLVLVANPILSVKCKSILQSVLMGSPFAVLSVLSIAFAYYTQKGNMWAYCSLLTVLPVAALALYLNGSTPVPAMALMILLLLGYDRYNDYQDEQRYLRVIQHYNRACEPTIEGQ